MKLAAAFAVSVSAIAAGPAAALEEISLPWTLEETHREISESVSYLLPVAPYRNGAVPSLSIDGRLERLAFRIDSGAPTIELTNMFRELLRQQGYSELFHCHDRGCGGFDFRAELDVVPVPAFYLDLRNFHYVAAERTGAETVYVAVLISRSAAAGFAQIDIASGAARRQTPTVTVAEQTAPGSPASIAGQLENKGHAVLESLEFASGSPDLGPGEYSQLRELAAYLEANPGARVLLVGHTDSKGSRDANFELSKLRAESVAARLVEQHGVPPERLSAEGIGFLAPRATNRTSEGRQLNRRVEAVLISSN